MKLKPLYMLMAALLSASAASATIIADFTSWANLIQTSPDIVIARCTAVPQSPMINGVDLAEIEVETVLKGETKPGRSKMASQYHPNRDDRFLIFAEYRSSDREYVPMEEYRVVPIHFPTSELTGKPPAEQIKIVLWHRIEELRNDHSKQAAEEKQRLEQGLYR